MNKVLLSFSLFAMTVLLVGCISIPLGDSVLEVSTDGIEFVTKDEEAVNEEVDKENQENNSELAENNEEDESVNESDDTAESDASTSNNGCEEQDHAQITDDIVPNFYIPDCAMQGSMSKSTSGMDLNFTVENGDWEEIFSAYKDYFGDKLSSESHNPESENAEVKAYLHEGDTSNYTLIQIYQKEENVSIRILHYFPED